MTIYLAHATSFCAGVWRPVVDALDSDDSVAWDFAGHGQGPLLEIPVDWARFGEQVLEETEPGGVGVGHSMGAAAMVMAQISDPDRFRALVLIEPIIFPGPYVRVDHPLSEGAEKRKRDFESREAARENFAGKEPFSNWHPDAIAGYLECGFVGDGPVRLACDPGIESEIYRGSRAHQTWERLSEVTIPVLVLSGANSDTIPTDLAREQASRFARAGLEVVPETGHFLPMERPDLVADRVSRLAAVLA